MPFAFIELITRDGYRSPDVPEGTSYLMLAEPGHGAPWAVYDYRLPPEAEGWRPRLPLSDELDGLLASGTRYPPALALARDEMSAAFRGATPSQAAFEAAYISALAGHLGRQREAGYLLARAKADQPGYLTRGEWYWVVGIVEGDALRAEPLHRGEQTSPSGFDFLLQVVPNSKSARWVSSDYEVYQDPVSDFELDPDAIESLGPPARRR